MQRKDSVGIRSGKRIDNLCRISAVLYDKVDENQQGYNADILQNVLSHCDSLYCQRCADLGETARYVIKTTAAKPATFGKYIAKSPSIIIPTTNQPV